MGKKRLVILRPLNFFDFFDLAVNPFFVRATQGVSKP
jgi:hypothetical protein